MQLRVSVLIRPSSDHLLTRWTSASSLFMNVSSSLVVQRVPSPFLHAAGPCCCALTMHKRSYSYWAWIVI